MIEAPASISTLNDYLQALLTGPQAENPDAGRRANTLHCEAEPHSLKNGIAEPDQAEAVEGPNGEHKVLVTGRLMVATPIDDRRSELERKTYATVHVSLAGFYERYRTIDALERALARYDHRAEWAKAHAIGEALLTTIETEYEHNRGNRNKLKKRILVGRLTRVAPTLAVQIDAAAAKLRAEQIRY